MIVVVALAVAAAAATDGWLFDDVCKGCDWLKSVQISAVILCMSLDWTELDHSVSKSVSKMQLTQVALCRGPTAQKEMSLVTT